MTLSEYLKPALAVVGVVVLGAGYYWNEHRSHLEVKDTPSSALVVVAKATNACFSDLVRVTGFIVPRREAVVGVEQEGSKVTDLLVHAGDMVTENQELARLTPPTAPSPEAMRGRRRFRCAPRHPGWSPRSTPSSARPPRPRPDRCSEFPSTTKSNWMPKYRPVHMLKLNPGATARISRDDAPDMVGRVRLISPQIDRANQLGHVRISMSYNPSLKVGMFARANIDAKRSCGVAIPRTAIDHLTVQVVKGTTVETRNVRVGLVSDTSIEILEGLDVGEIVVADAGSSLHDGDQIKTMFAEDLDRTRVR